MDRQISKRVNMKRRVLSTEVDFGFALLNVCCLELSFGDAVRAARALSEARDIHQATSLMLEELKVGPVLRRKITALANLLSRIDESVLELQDVAAKPGAEHQCKNDGFADHLQNPLVRTASSAP
jgi:hypothetical protein